MTGKAKQKKQQRQTKLQRQMGIVVTEMKNSNLT
jgi:hypothetical protein